MLLLLLGSLIVLNGCSLFSTDANIRIENRSGQDLRASIRIDETVFLYSDSSPLSNNNRSEYKVVKNGLHYIYARTSLGPEWTRLYYGPIELENGGSYTWVYDGDAQDGKPPYKLVRDE